METGKNEIVLVFDRSCPFTTGIYIARALKTTPYIESATGLQSPPETPVIMIDDSSHWSDEHEWVLAHPRRCFWAIDTHTAWDRCLEIARHFPLVFAAQRDGADALRIAGINAHWLPVAAEPDGYHRDRGVERDIDVAFVGNQVTQERREILRLVDAAFDSFVTDNSGKPEMIGELYSRAKVVINHSIRNDVNMRIFEAASCGAGIVTNRIERSQWEDIGIAAWEYGGVGDVVETITEALDACGQRAVTGAVNRLAICQRHTYAHRLETMLAGLNNLPA